MDKGKNLLPWILGGLSMAAVAFASVGWTKGVSPTDLPAPSQTAAQLPDAETATAAAPAPAARVALIQPVIPPPAPNVERNHPIWACTINGQKTFSDNPCGAKSTRLEISPINRMDPTPILPTSRSHVPESSDQPNYFYPSGQANSYPSEQQSADDSYATDNSYAAYNSYPVFLGSPFSGRGRPGGRPDREERGRSDHEHRPYSQPPSRPNSRPNNQPPSQPQSHNRGPQPLRN
jgi:hypothetical protein